MDTPQLHDHQQYKDTLQQELQTKDQQLQDSQRHMHALQEELQDSQRRVDTLQYELQDSQQCVDNLQQELQDSQRCRDTLQQELQTNDQQLQANEQVIAEFQRNLLEHVQTNSQLRRALKQAVEEKQAGERQLQELTQQLQTMKLAGPQTITPQVAAQPQDIITRPGQELQAQQMERVSKGRKGQLRKLKIQQLPVMKQTATQPQKALMQLKTIGDMKWQKESKAPERMCRGSAASDNSMVYFNGDGSTKVHSYDSDTQKWHQLPDTPLTQCTLVVVQNILTMVGGNLRGKVTNCLLSLMGEGGATKWLPHFPAMPTARSDTAAVSSGHSLIVTGGMGDGYNRLVTVEVLDTDTQQWSTACSLPYLFSLATISICGDRLYLMATGNETRSVLSCSIHDLLQSQTQPLTGKLRTAPVKQTTKWQQIAAAPHCHSSYVTICRQLVAVGGRDGDKDTTAISVYKETSDSWEAMGNMPTARCMTLVVTLNGKLMVVGGSVGGHGWLWGTRTDVVEILC